MAIMGIGGYREIRIVRHVEDEDGIASTADHGIVFQPAVVPCVRLDWFVGAFLVEFSRDGVPARFRFKLVVPWKEVVAEIIPGFGATEIVDVDFGDGRFGGGAVV